METIAVVDTSICTDNLGDEIIMDAVNDVIAELFPNAYIFRVPSHEALSDRTHKFIDLANFIFIGGTSILSSNIKPYGNWRLRSEDVRKYGATHTICLGTGCIGYMPAPTLETRNMLLTALSNQFVHSVRDEYTGDHLANVGLAAINTSCPTMWSLTTEHCARIPSTRAPDVVFTLTYWRANIEADRAFVELLRRIYRKIYFFPQQQADWKYFRLFGWEDVRLIRPSVGGYNHFLENEDVDFVGTRLHGGIRALQKQRRALILSVDNRAAELSKDTRLPTAPRADIRAIREWIEGSSPTVIDLPQDAIVKWKMQFTPNNLRNIKRPELSSNCSTRLTDVAADFLRPVKRAVMLALKLR